MRKLLLFTAGGAVGFVLGARAGRPAYDRIVESWNQFAESSGISRSAGTMSGAVDDLRDAGMQRASDGLGSLADDASDAIKSTADRLRDTSIDVSEPFTSASPDVAPRGQRSGS